MGMISRKGVEKSEGQSRGERKKGQVGGHVKGIKEWEGGGFDSVRAGGGDLMKRRQ